MTTRKPVQPPCGGLLSSRYVYVPQARTDIRVTFERAREALGPTTTVRVPYQRLGRKGGA